LSGTGLTGPAVLAAVSGRSAAGPVRSVRDMLMMAGAYRVGRSGRTDLFDNVVFENAYAELKTTKLQLYIGCVFIRQTAATIDKSKSEWQNMFLCCWVSFSPSLTLNIVVTTVTSVVV